MSQRNRIVKSDLQLRRWYLKFNDLYFGSRLPYKLAIYWEPTPGYLAYCEQIKADEPEMLIRIDPALKWSQVLAKFTLLHEMCHIALSKRCGHGKKFQDEMLRLAKMGAFRFLW